MRRLSVGLLSLGLFLCACGVPTQSDPEPIHATRPTGKSPVMPTAGRSDVEVYFVRGTRLEAVRRTATPSDQATALDLLTSGPSRSEVAGGLRTALTPQVLRATGPRPSDPSVTITVTRDFTGIVGADQLLALAQVVWTVTQFPGVRSVRFQADREPLEVATDHGLTALPVSRDDYRSAAPATASQPAAPPAPSGTPPSAPPGPTTSGVKRTRGTALEREPRRRTVMHA
jgi:Sporulation and spore germination